MRRSSYFQIAVLAFAVLVPILPVRCEEEESEMDKGLTYYRVHNYHEAMGHFGAALPNEFNNANLHYHLANCMVHLRQKDGAIREYRIAYAMDPKGKVGNYSKMCLHLFGIDATGVQAAKESKKKADDDDAKGKEKEKSKDNDGLASVSKYIAEGDKTAINLDALVREKPRAGKPQLQRVGTNLFVRNYKDPKLTVANAVEKAHAPELAAGDEKPGSKQQPPQATKSTAISKVVKPVSQPPAPPAVARPVSKPRIQNSPASAVQSFIRTFTNFPR